MAQISRIGKFLLCEEPGIRVLAVDSAIMPCIINITGGNAGEAGVGQTAVVMNRTSKRMKLHLFVAFFCAGLTCFGEILFTGGNGQDLTVTFTQPLAIPFNAPSDGNSLGFALVLEDIYSTPQPQQGFSPDTPYGSPGSITSTLQYQNGSSLLGTGYAMWGTPGFDLGVTDERDFIAAIQFYYPSLPNAQPGDTLLIGAGSIVIPHFLGIVRPDLPVSTIQISNGSTGHPFSAAWPIESVTVPEPTAAGLVCIGFGMLWVCRRGELIAKNARIAKCHILSR